MQSKQRNRVITLAALVSFGFLILAAHVSGQNIVIDRGSKGKVFDGVGAIGGGGGNSRLLID